MGLPESEKNISHHLNVPLSLNRAMVHFAYSATGHKLTKRQEFNPTEVL